jgi:hypothetical protein
MNSSRSSCQASRIDGISYHSSGSTFCLIVHALSSGHLGPVAFAVSPSMRRQQQTGSSRSQLVAEGRQVTEC